MKTVLKVASTVAAVLILAMVVIRVVPGVGPALANAGMPAGMLATITGQPAEAQPGAGANQSAGARRGGGGRPPSLVEGELAESQMSSSRLRTLGSGDALASVAVVAEMDGVIASVEVGSGATVKAGDVLLRIDNRDALLARDRAEQVISDARRTLERAESLLGAQAGSAVEVDTASYQLANAQLDRRGAELALERSVVRSPIDGVLGLIDVGAGDYVNEGDPLMTVDDRSELVITFRTPEQFASRVGTGQSVQLTSSAIPGRTLEGTVSAVGSRLDERTRTLAVEAIVDNANDLLRPGMSFGVELEFEGNSYTAVHPLAIQWDSDGSYVWTIDDDKAQRVGVEIVQRDSDSVLVESDVTPGQVVLTAGVLSLRPGAPVRLAEESPTRGADASDYAPRLTPDTSTDTSSGTTSVAMLATTETVAGE